MSAAEASGRAKRLYPRSAAFRSAYLKGAAAARAGRPQASCPYRPGDSTWRRAFRLAWMRGFLSEGDEE